MLIQENSNASSISDIFTDTLKKNYNLVISVQSSQPRQPARIVKLHSGIAKPVPAQKPKNQKKSS